MPARPRLVEEGTPIPGSSTHDAAPTKNGGWEEAVIANYEAFAGESAAPEAKGTATVSSASPIAKVRAGKPGGSSSLAAAAARNYSPALSGMKPGANDPGPRLKTRLVIGGDDDIGGETEHEDELMEDSGGNHLSPPRPSLPLPRLARGSKGGSGKSNTSTFPHRIVIGGGDDEVQEQFQPMDGVVSQSEMQPHQQPGHHPVLPDPKPSDIFPSIECFSEEVDRMMVDDIIPKPPLVVLDGANVAYAYGEAKNGTSVDSDLFRAGGRSRRRHRLGLAEADTRGIVVAVDHLILGGARVQVVLPAPWLRTKPRAGDIDRTDASMITPQLEVLRGLKERGLLCAAPPADDDDAYAILLAWREDGRAARRRGGDGEGGSILERGGGFVLSNDFFRDATRRDDDSPHPTGLRGWLEGKSSSSSFQPPGRISYSFADIGSTDEYGDRLLDFVPNPRHALVEEMEQELRAREHSLI